MDDHRAQWRSLAADPRAVDAVLVLAGLALTALAVKGHWSVLPGPAIAVAGAVGSLAQWPRRRWPELSAVGGAAGYALSGNPLPAVVGLYSAGSHAPRRRVWAAAVVGWCGLAGWAWINAGRLSWLDAAATAGATALIVGVGVHVATRRALAESWQERANRAEAERQLRDEPARSAERARIAREMHDVVAHKVALIALHAGALELGARDGTAPVRDGAALIRSTAREALEELRSVLGLLQADPPAGPDAPFADLASLVAASVRAGQAVELRDDGGPLPPATGRVVYRVVQEGLTNAHKHAPDAPVTVTVDRDPAGDVTVTVHNPAPAGPPMDLPGSGSGLVGLAERIRLVGGTLHSGPLAGGGWRLRAVVPGTVVPGAVVPGAVVPGAVVPGAEEPLGSTPAKESS
jgi:signal transduction histidine kinase